MNSIPNSTPFIKDPASWIDLTNETLTKVVNQLSTECPPTEVLQCLSQLPPALGDRLFKLKSLEGKAVQYVVYYCELRRVAEINSQLSDVQTQIARLDEDLSQLAADQAELRSQIPKQSDQLRQIEKTEKDKEKSRAAQLSEIEKIRAITRARNAKTHLEIQDRQEALSACETRIEALRKRNSQIEAELERGIQENTRRKKELQQLLSPFAIFKIL